MHMYVMNDTCTEGLVCTLRSLQCPLSPSSHLSELCHILFAERRLADDGGVARPVLGAAKLVPSQGSHDGLLVAGGILGADVIQQRPHARIGET